MIDFAIIGAQKSGTTALAHFLDQHLAVAMTRPKEAHIFDAEDYDPEDVDRKYMPFFEHASKEQLKGDATPIYLFWQDVLKRLYNYKAGLKVIVLLRDPVDRAISHYEMEQERGNEQLPLWLALLMESNRLKHDTKPKAEQSATRNHSYRTRGYYTRQLKGVLEIFPSDQVLIITMENLLKKHDQTLAQVFSFLGVDSNIRVQHEIVFSGGKQRKLYPFSRFILRLCYLLEYCRLQRYVE